MLVPGARISNLLAKLASSVSDRKPANGGLIRTTPSQCQPSGLQAARWQLLWWRNAFSAAIKRLEKSRHQLELFRAREGECSEICSGRPKRVFSCIIPRTSATRILLLPATSLLEGMLQSSSTALHLALKGVPHSAEVLAEGDTANPR